MSSSPHIDVCSSPERVPSPPMRCCPQTPGSPKGSPKNSSAYTSFSISSILSREPERRDNSLDVAHLAAAAALHPCHSDSAMLSRYDHAKYSTLRYVSYFNRNISLVLCPDKENIYFIIQAKNETI